MIFLTVGTQFPFDRLVKAVDKAIESVELDEEIYAQVGDSSYRPRNFKTVSYMDKKEYDEFVKKASGLISHAGMGSIMMALNSSKPLLVMPRLKKYGEVVNDHQLSIAGKFEKLGHILVAYNEDELLDKLTQLKDFVPLKRDVQCEAIIERISSYLQQVQGCD
jgi:beta-1,4-N-acetylglucosaminyltransferase